MSLQCRKSHGGSFDLDAHLQAEPEALGTLNKWSALSKDLEILERGGDCDGEEAATRSIGAVRQSHPSWLLRHCQAQRSCDPQAEEEIPPSKAGKWSALSRDLQVLDKPGEEVSEAPSPVAKARPAAPPASARTSMWRRCLPPRCCAGGWGGREQVECPVEGPLCSGKAR